MASNGDDIDAASSLMPYQAWVEEAMREVVMRALEEAARYGLPGQHHLYITFQTTYPGVNIPQRLSEKYPQEMTIVLQHQFRDLVIDRAAGFMRVGLSFGGIPSTLVIPFAAITAFADPSVQFGLQFTVAPAEAEIAPAPPEIAPASAAEETPVTPQVVSLDAFRRKRD